MAEDQVVGCQVEGTRDLLASTQEGYVLDLAIVSERREGWWSGLLNLCDSRPVHCHAGAPQGRPQGLRIGVWGGVIGASHGKCLVQ